MRRECSALPASAPPLVPCPVSSSPMTCVLGLVLGRRRSGNKDLGCPRVCPFAKTQVGVGGLYSLTQLLLLAALYELDLIFSLYFANCHLFGNVVLSWLLWFSRALRPFSSFLTNPLNECFSFSGVMGEKGWPGSSLSNAALKLSWTYSLWISTWHSDIKTGRALRHLVSSSLEASLRVDCNLHKRSTRLTAFHQPCKLGDCDCSNWRLVMADGVISVDPLILNGPSCKSCARVGYQRRVWSLLKIGTCYSLFSGVTVVTSAQKHFGCLGDCVVGRTPSLMALRAL
jgi:hypothetical protein